MQNLREKLLKAGLVTSDEAKQADDRAKHKPAPRSAEPRSAEPPPRSAEPQGRIPKLPPLPGSREHQRLQSKKQLELDRQIRELVLAAEVPVQHGDQVFHFVTRKNRLRRLELSPAMRDQLERGELAVVERPEPAQIEHALVPTAAADQLLSLSERSVRFFNKAGSAVGFLTDDELKDRQAQEATLPPDSDSREDAEA